MRLVAKLGISFACKYKSIHTFKLHLFIYNRLSYFDSGPKRQHNFELLISFYSNEKQFKEAKGREIISFSKTKCLERQRSYRNF